MDEGLVVVVRGIIAFFTLLIFTRILGKQQVNQLTFFEYVLGITIGSSAASLASDLATRAWTHWIALVILAALTLLMQWVTTKWRYASKYLDGEPVIVIMNGRIMENALRKMRFRVSDLLELLRGQGIFDLNEVAYAVIEIGGQVSVLKKAEYQPVTPKDMGLKTQAKAISSELIYDGNIVEQNLKDLNLSHEWLNEQLKFKNIKDPSEVFLAMYSPDTGILYVDTYRDYVKKFVDMSDYKGPY